MKQYLKLNNEVLNEYSATGVLNLEKDREATKQYFLEEINTKFRYFIDLNEKINYLINNGYYEKEYLINYPFKTIKKVFKEAYSYNFRFPSFMSASKFYSGYAMRSKDGNEILEKYEDRMAICALYLARGDAKLAIDLVHAFMQNLQPATPTFLNSGKAARGELVSCFILTMDDAMNSIAENLGYSLELSRLGGGVGVNLTDLRPLGDPIKKILNRASGTMPVAKLLENSFSYSNQLGQRNGSGVVWLNIFHADIENFVSAKKPNADEKIRLATLSTGVVIPDIFFELMKKDKDIVLFSPYDIYNEYGKRMSEISITEMYYELLDNPNIRNIKRVNARQLYTEIKKAQFESGYPFEMFDDNVNALHALNNVGRVKNTNLCTEVLQAQITSVITDQDRENKYGLDVSCNLASLDIHATTKVDFEKSVETAMRGLTAVSDMTNIVNVPSVAKANRLMHSVGLGAMNMHGHLASQGIEYGSDDSIAFTDYFFEAMDYFSLKASVKIAQETGETFYGFEGSDYATGKYIVRKMGYKRPVLTDKVKQALGTVPVISVQMWKDLQDEIDEHGVYHSYRMAIAPTGSISYVRSCTASIAPITEKVEVRDYQDSRTIYPMPHLKSDNSHLFKDAYEIDQYKMIDLYAAAQKHVDQGISMTVYVTNQWTTEQLTRLYVYAWLKGIKTVYYVRQRLIKLEDKINGIINHEELTIEECEACSI